MTIIDLKKCTDGELIKLYVQNQHQSEAVMKMLMNRHSRVLYGRIIARVGNESDAKDLQQELWVKVARSLHKYKDEGKFEHYLSRLVSNLIIDFYRKSGRDKDMFVDDAVYENSDASHEGGSYSILDNHEDPSQNAEQQIVDNQLINYLTSVLIPALPVEQRTAWLLRHESEYWEPERPFGWHHLAELNNLTETQTAEIFETARDKLVNAANSDTNNTLDELELLVFLVWTQAHRHDKSKQYTWDYFADLLAVPVNTMKTRYRSAQRSLNNSLTEYMKS